MASKGKKVDTNNGQNDLKSNVKAKPEIANVITQFSDLIDLNFPLNNDDEGLTLQERYESKKMYFASLCEINTLIRDIRNRCIEDMKKLYRLSVNTDEAEVENLDNEIEADIDPNIEDVPSETPVKVNKTSKSKKITNDDDLNEDDHAYPEEKTVTSAKKGKKPIEKKESTKTSVKATDLPEADGSKIVKAVKTKNTKVKASNDDDGAPNTKITKTEKVVKQKEPKNDTIEKEVVEKEKKTVKKQVLKKKV